MPKNFCYPEVLYGKGLDESLESFEAVSTRVQGAEDGNHSVAYAL